MLTYYVVIVLSVLLAVQAGSRVAAGADGTLLPPRRGVARLAAFLVGALLVGVAALRFRVGVDYGQYRENYFYGYRSFSLSDITWDGEPGIQVFALVARFLHDDPVTMFVLASLLTVGLMVRTYATYSSWFSMTILLFVLAGTWHGTFNGVRQFAAAAIVLAGHQLLLERRFVRYLLVVALASLFHLSAWVLLLLYFVPRRRLSLLGIVVVFGGAMAIWTGYDALGGIADSVKEDDISSGTYFAEQLHPLRVLLAAAPFVVARLFGDKDLVSERGNLYINLTLVHAGVYLAAMGSAYLARFGLYTNVFLALAWPVILQSCRPRTRPLLIAGVVVVYALFWYLEVSREPALNPFRWVEGW